MEDFLLKYKEKYLSNVLLFITIMCFVGFVHCIIFKIWLYAISYTFFIILLLMFVWVIKRSTLEKSIILYPVFIAIMILLLSCNCFLMMQNGSQYYCIYYSVIIVGVIIFLSAKTAFYTTIISIAMYLLLVILTNIFKDDILVVLPPKQLLIMDIILLTGAGCGTLCILYSGWQMEKIKENVDENLLSPEEIEQEQEKYQLLYSKIITAFEIDKIYKDAEITMAELANKLDTNVTYIYKALKQHGIEDSFVNFTNKYRVKAFKDQIEGGNYNKFTIQHLYEQCGFKHQSTFNKVFKQFEGVTPSEYIAMYKAKQKRIKN